MASSGTADDSSDQFVTYISTLYDLAIKYGTNPPNGGTADSSPAAANQRVTEWLRHEDYNNLKFNLLIGSVDELFTSYVVTASPTTMTDYQDPGHWPVQVKISHLGAVMNAVFVKGAATASTIDRADAAGWGGNLMAFYAAWRTAVKNSPDAEKYCQTNLAKATGGDASFTMANLIEVADGYNIAARLLTDTQLSIADAVKTNLQNGGSYSTRLHDFYAARFGGTGVRTIAAAQAMLLSCDDSLIAAGRWRLIYGVTGSASDYPSEIGIESLRAFCRGLADVLQDFVKQEQAAAP